FKRIKISFYHLRVDSRRLDVIGFTQGETKGFLQIKASHGKNRKEYGFGFLMEIRGYEIRLCGNKRINFEGINDWFRWISLGFFGSQIRSEDGKNMWGSIRVNLPQYTTHDYTRRAAFSYTGMLRKEGVAVRVLTWWDLVRISWILVRICPEQAHGCSYLIVIDDSKLDCDLDLIKLSVSGGNRQMRTRCVQCYRSNEVLTYWYKRSCHGTRQMQRIQSSFFGACLIAMETWFILTVVDLQGVHPREGRSLNEVSLNTFKFLVVRFLLQQRREYYGALGDGNRVVKTRNHGNIYLVALDEGFFNKDVRCSWWGFFKKWCIFAMHFNKLCEQFMVQCFILYL
ncbi:hypothetical protein IGI04_007281, partial [Brassica rapa subsp. trilocularis]